MQIPNRVPWVNAVVGILTIISPFVSVPNAAANKWSGVIDGTVIAVVALAEMGAYGRNAKMNYWPAINILAGIWLFISTMFAAGNVTIVWSDIVLGAIAIVTALVSLSYERLHDVRHPTATPHT
jgi:hypothetical protein